MHRVLWRRSLGTDLGMVYLKSWGMRKIGLGGLYVKLSAHVLGVSQTWTDCRIEHENAQGRGRRAAYQWAVPAVTSNFVSKKSGSTY